MRHITDEGLALIMNYEGFRSESYICPGGYPTIGYGHVVRPGDPESIDIHEAHALLRKDVQTAERSVLRLISIPLTDNQYDALVSFTFNLGGGALQRSTLRKKINRGEHESVPAEFMKWCRAGGRVVKGLLLRRQAEAELYQS